MDMPKIKESLHIVMTDYSGTVSYYLNKETGEIVSDLEGDLDEEELDNDTYVYVEPISSQESYQFMEEFIETVTDPELKRRLKIAINGRGAFRMFWQTLGDYPQEKKRWITFEEKKIDQCIDRWIENLPTLEKKVKP